MDCQSCIDIHGIPDRVIARCMFKLTVPGCPWIVRVTLTFVESLTVYRLGVMVKSVNCQHY